MVVFLLGGCSGSIVLQCSQHQKEGLEGASIYEQVNSLDGEGLLPYCHGWVVFPPHCRGLCECRLSQLRGRGVRFGGLPRL